MILDRECGDECRVNLHTWTAGWGVVRQWDLKKVTTMGQVIAMSHFVGMFVKDALPVADGSPARVHAGS